MDYIYDADQMPTLNFKLHGDFRKKEHKLTRPASLKNAKAKSCCSNECCNKTSEWIIHQERRRIHGVSEAKKKKILQRMIIVDTAENKKYFFGGMVR